MVVAVAVVVVVIYSQAETFLVVVVVVVVVVVLLKNSYMYNKCSFTHRPSNTRFGSTLSLDFQRTLRRSQPRT